MFFLHFPHLSLHVYYERKDVSGITVELLCATILFHLSKKETANNNESVQPYQPLISLYHLGINPRLLMHLQSLEYSLMPESQLVRRAFWQLKLQF